MRVCVGSPGIFSTRKCAVGDARDLREMRDRQHLRALGEALERRRDGVRRDAADAGVDLVEDERLARPRPPRARARCARARRPRRSRRPGRTGGPRSGGRGTRPRRRPSGPARARAARRGTRPPPCRAPAARPRPPARTRSACARRSSRSASASASMRASPRRPPPARPPRPGRARRQRRRAPRARRRGALEQLVVRRRAEPALEIGDPLEPPSTSSSERRVGLERGEEAVQVAADLAQPKGDVAELAGGRAELRREPLERRERPLGTCRERCRAVAVLGRDRLAAVGDAATRARRRGGDARAARAARPRRPPRDPRWPPRALELGEPRGHAVGVAGQLVVTAARGPELAPGVARLAPALELLRRRRTRRARRAGTQGRASRRCSNCPDIAISRSTAAARSSRATARPHAYARVRPSPNTRRASTRPGLALRPELGERRDVVLVEEAVRHVELRLDVGLRARPRRSPTRPRARRAAARSPARRSSCPRRSRP